MSFARLKETFFRLGRPLKFIGIGAAILAISTIMPWYADLDTYRYGDEFLGLTGPASFAGIAVLVLSGLSLWIFSYHLLERRMMRLPVREAIVHLFVGIESLFLLFIVNSIYFHPKFGVNITLKESRFGMTIAVIGAVLLVIGGYLKNKDEMAQADESGKLEPLIKMPEQTIQANPPAYGRPHSVIHGEPKQSASAPVQRKIFPRSAERERERERERGFLFGEGSASRSEPVKPAPEKKEEKGGGGSFMIRTDL